MQLSVNKKKIIYVVNVDWFFLSHRLPLAMSMLDKGYEVHLAANITDRYQEVTGLGLIVHPINLHRSRTGLFALVREILELFILFRSVKPDLVHLVTIKPVLLGGLAARMARVPSVLYAVSGLGYNFIAQGVLPRVKRAVILFIYKLVFGHKNCKVIFQNKTDKSVLSKSTNVSSDQSVLIHGSGVDLSLYKPNPPSSNIPVVMMASRLLADKGVREFVDAASLVNKTVKRARFVLVGDIDPHNPASIAQEELNHWSNDSIVELWGFRTDMEKILVQANIVVLPSYREGFPKILIEAAAAGRAIVTTDVPGCRDAIENGVTGLLVNVRDYKDLANKIIKLLDDIDLCVEMGLAGRNRAEKMFDLNVVIDAHVNTYENLLKNAYS